MQSSKRALVRGGLWVAGIAVGVSAAAQVPIVVATTPAEDTAAAVADPSWKAPRTSWGHPSLEGVYSTDDMRERAARPARGDGHARETHAGGVRRAREVRCRRARSRAQQIFILFEQRRQPNVRLDVADHRSAERPHAAALRRRAGALAAARPRLVRRRTVRHVRGLPSVRPLHHARHLGLVVRRHLRQRRPHRSESRQRRHQLRDAGRFARDPARRAAARAGQLEAVSRKLARLLGRRHARRRDEELQRQDEHRRQRHRHAPQRSNDVDGTAHASRPRDGRVLARRSTIR